MNTILRFAGATALALALAGGLAFAQNAADHAAHHPGNGAPGSAAAEYGPCPYGMGPWMMGRAGWMGPGMMGGGWRGYGSAMMSGWRGYGPAMMGSGWQARQRILNLSPSDVKTYFEHWIALSGNRHIKVGNVVAKDGNTITADIVTADKDALVQRFDVDRHTGVFRPAS